MLRVEVDPQVNLVDVNVTVVSHCVAVETNRRLTRGVARNRCWGCLLAVVGNGVKKPNLSRHQQRIRSGACKDSDWGSGVACSIFCWEQMHAYDTMCFVVIWADTVVFFRFFLGAKHTLSATNALKLQVHRQCLGTQGVRNVCLKVDVQFSNSL